MSYKLLKKLLPNHNKYAVNTLYLDCYSIITCKIYIRDNAIISSDVGN
jgi:hypothetical protein